MAEILGLSQNWIVSQIGSDLIILIFKSFVVV